MSDAMTGSVGSVGITTDEMNAVVNQAEQEARKLRHDIKGCLNALKLSAAILDRAKLAEDKVESLECISSSADELSGLLEKLGVEFLPPVTVGSVPNAA